MPFSPAWRATNVWPNVSDAAASALALPLGTGTSVSWEGMQLARQINATHKQQSRTREKLRHMN